MEFSFLCAYEMVCGEEKKKKFRVLVHDKRNLKIIPVQQSQLDVVETEEHTQEINSIRVFVALPFD